MKIRVWKHFFKKIGKTIAVITAGAMTWTIAGLPFYFICVWLDVPSLEDRVMISITAPAMLAFISFFVWEAYSSSKAEIDKENELIMRRLKQ